MNSIFVLTNIVKWEMSHVFSSLACHNLTSLLAVRFGNKVLRSDSIAILRERRKNEPIESMS